MKILSIGNSFSQDAQRYLKAIAHRQGDWFKCVNLYIGGCPLERHHANLLSDAKAYSFELGGESSGLLVSIREVLLSDNWDVVTLQQASHFSAYFDTYVPYIDVLAQEIRRCVPKAKLYIHQTWAYEEGSSRLQSQGEGKTHDSMFADVHAAYQQAAERIGADGIIPGGEAMHAAYKAGVKPMYRDGFHASLGVDRLLLGLTWYQTLTGKKVERADIELDEDVDEATRAKLIEISARISGVQ